MVESRPAPSSGAMSPPRAADTKPRRRAQLLPPERLPDETEASYDRRKYWGEAFHRWVDAQGLSAETVDNVLLALDDARIEYDTTMRILVDDMATSPLVWDVDPEAARESLGAFLSDGAFHASVIQRVADVVGDEAARDFGARFPKTTWALVRSGFFRVTQEP
jgi:hypothetical protein